MVTRDPGYRLDLPPDSLDLRQFERLCSLGRAARDAGDLAGALGRYREATALWKGPRSATSAPRSCWTAWRCGWRSRASRPWSGGWSWRSGSAATPRSSPNCASSPPSTRCASASTTSSWSRSASPAGAATRSRRSASCAARSSPSSASSPARTSSACTSRCCPPTGPRSLPRSSGNGDLMIVPRFSVD
ncbi:hypothetical protein GEV43_23280 [Actinomadura sp. J1-007]|nr:hypothetical protein [Actinomadura sp. J1-007]